MLRAEAYAAIAVEKLKTGQPHTLMLQLQISLDQENAKNDYSLALHTLNDYFYFQVTILRNHSTNLDEFKIWYEEYTQEHKEITQEVKKVIKQSLKAAAIELPDNIFNRLFPEVDNASLLQAEIYHMQSYEKAIQEKRLEQIELNQLAIAAYKESAKGILDNSISSDVLLLVYGQIRKKYGALIAEKFMNYTLEISELESQKIQQAFYKLVKKVKKQLEEAKKKEEKK